VVKFSLYIYGLGELCPNGIQQTVISIRLREFTGRQGKARGGLPELETAEKRGSSRSTQSVVPAELFLFNKFPGIT
jgi:hypothetical protein